MPPLSEPWLRFERVAHLHEFLPQIEHRLELFLILQDEQARDALEKTCGERIEALFRKHRAAIRARSTSDQEEYNKVREVAKDPEALEFRPPTDIVVAVDRAKPSGIGS